MDSAAPDSVLVERARLGDHDAFAALVRRHEGAVAAVVIRMLGPGDDADDVGQEAFVRFHRGLASFRGEAAVRTYLTRIAINLSMNALARRRWRWTRFVRADAGAGLDLAAPEAGADVELLRGERAARVQQALLGLEPEHRAVVILRLFEEHSTRATAEILGVPEGTVMSRLKRALDKLRGELGDLEEET